MARAVERHVELIDKAVADHGGVFVKSKGEGDSTFSVFTRPSDAVAAAVATQRALTTEGWPSGIRVRARAAVHTGEAELREGDYYGTTVNRCARLRSVAHGGQIVCSQTTTDLVADGPPDGVVFRSLGTHRLKDLERTEHIYQVEADGLDVEFPPLRSLDAFRHNLPTQRTTFVGREDEIRVIQKYLDSGRLVALTGVGGCGKTRLALQVAAESLDLFADGVFFVDLAPVSDPDAVPSAVAMPLGVRSTSGRPIRDDLIDALASSDVLLILDNCEHLVEACAELADDVLDRCPRVRILATSREAFGIDGEHNHPVPSLAVPSADDDLSSEATRLFADRASTVRESFELGAASAASVAQICRRLDGIPLAIELAAAQVVHMSPKQIAERLDDRFVLLTGGRRRVQRQQTLAATLDWSYELLTEDERTMLRRLAVFPGSFSLEAAEAIAGPTETLRSLVAKSMVTTEQGDELRYRMLETVRLYAEDKLLASGEAEEVRSHHCVHFLELGERQVGPRWWSLGSFAEGQNFASALAWADRIGRDDLVSRLVGVMPSFWLAYGPEEGRRWVERALESLDSVDLDLQVRLLVARSEMGIGLLEPAERIRSFAERAIELAGDRRVPGMSLAHGTVAFMRSWEAVSTGEDVTAEIERHAELAVERAIDEYDAATGLSYIGIAYMNMRDTARAITFLERTAGTINADTDFLWFPALISLSVLYHLEGDHARALEYAEKALIETSPFPTDWKTVTAATVAVARGGLGRFDEAYAELRRCVVLARVAKLPGVGVSLVTALGALAAMRGDWERASICLAKSREYYARQVIRSPAEGLLYQHYVRLVRDAVGDRAKELRERAASMSLEDTLAHGLDV
jgi:predicted ATPase/tetratricopeptide (TPR) repeat protein